jgi:inhibitor of KinA sporulation pathway (predicted exonuclease)
MQQVEEFMAALFRTRMEEERRILANRAPYRQRFFTPDCRWDNRAFTLEMIETERIISVETSETEGAVVTEFKASVSPRGARINRRRYHLGASGDGWLISKVEAQCPLCHGQGDQGCLGCKGKHWL